MNDLETKVHDLNVDKVKSVHVDLRRLKKLRDAVDDEVFKNTKFNTIKTKLNNLEKKIPNAFTLIHINQYNTERQNLERKNGGVRYEIDTSRYDLIILNTFSRVNRIKISSMFKSGWLSEQNSFWW